MEGNTLKITCQGNTLINIDDLNDFQENLKDLTEENYQKLRQSMFEHGFSFPVFYWIDENGKKWIIDAHQRRRVLLKMREEGFIIPLLPADPIQANNREHAKKKLLLLNSPYGKMTQEGFDAFTSDINIDDISDMLVLPDVMFEGQEQENDKQLPKYESKFQVVVEIDNEIEQQEAYEKLTELGYKCKVLTI